MQIKLHFYDILSAFLQQTVKKLSQILLAAGSYVTVYQFTVIEEQHRRNIHDAVLLTGVRILVHVQFANHYTTVVLIREVFLNR